MDRIPTHSDVNNNAYGLFIARSVPAYSRLVPDQTLELKGCSAVAKSLKAHEFSGGNVVYKYASYAQQRRDYT